MDSAIHQINLYPVDSAIIGFLNTYHWIVIYPKDSTIQHLNVQQPIPDGHPTHYKVPHGASWGTNWFTHLPLSTISHSLSIHPP